MTRTMTDAARHEVVMRLHDDATEGARALAHILHAEDWKSRQGEIAELLNTNPPEGWSAALVRMFIHAATAHPPDDDTLRAIVTKAPGKILPLRREQVDAGPPVEEVVMSDGMAHLEAVVRQLPGEWYVTLKGSTFTLWWTSNVSVYGCILAERLNLVFDERYQRWVAD